MSSSKAGCPHFNIARPIAKEMGVSEKGISVYIEAYNEAAVKLGKPEISDEEYFSLNEAERQSYLQRNAKLLSIFINEFNRRKVDNAEDWDSIRQALGSKAAFAFTATASQFSAEERESFRCELVGILRHEAKRRGITEGELIDKATMSKLLYNVRGVYENALLDWMDALNAKMEGDDSIPESVAEIEYKIDFLYRILGDPDNRTEYPGLFSELCIINSSEIKRLFGRTFNPESNTVYKEDETDNIHVDEELDLDIEEDERERWTIMMDSMDPSGSLSAIINNILGQIPDTRTRHIYGVDDNGNATIKETQEVKKKSQLILTTLKDEEGNEYDDFFPVTVNPRVEARRLLRLINSCVTLSDMMNKLGKEGKYKMLYEELEKNPRIQTTFMTAFKRYYLHYYYTESHRDGTFSEIHLNASGNFNRANAYINKLQRSESLKDNPLSVFKYNDEGTKLVTNKKNAVRFANDFVALIKREGDAKIEIGDFVNSRSTSQKVVAVQKLLAYLNIDMREEDLQVIVSDSTQLYNLLDALSSLSTFINSNGSNSKPIASMFAANDEGYNQGRYALTTILEITESMDEYGSGLSGMVTFSGEKTKTLSANVMMSQLTQFIKECNSSSAEDLKNILIDTYAGDSALCEVTEDGFDEEGNPKYNYRFKVRWLQDLYESLNQTSGRSFRKRFRVSRNLGMDQIDFDHISDTGHMMCILSMYFNNLNTNSKIKFVQSRDEINTGDNDTYYYMLNSSQGFYKSAIGEVLPVDRSRTIMIPTFITGDTLALRGVTSLHYDEREIIDGIYDFYRVDVATSQKAEEFNALGLPVSGNGKESFTKNPKYLGFCAFFNPTYVAKVKEGGKWVTKEPGYWAKKLAAVSETYNDTLIKSLIKECLDSEFEYFYEVRLKELGISEDSLNISSKGVGDDFRAKIKDFYLNFRFSQMNQTAIIDCSPKFFANSKEHQKRNKVALTNGIQLVTDAKDPNSNYVWEDPVNPKQKVVYVYDIKPALSEEDEAMLAKVFEGSDYNYTDVYGSNTISDGQGWRSFSSWRKIGLSFQGKIWTQEMEDAYHQIQKLSEEIYALEDQLENFSFELKSGNFEELQEAYKKDNKAIIEGKLAAKVSQLAELAVVFQPRKPVCNGIEQFSTDGSTGRFAAIPFQHKYAEIPVIPAMYPKGSALRVLGQFMEDRGIDMICSDKCGKKGVFGEIDFQYKVNENGQYIDAEGRVIPGVDAEGNIVDNPTRGEQRRYKLFSKRAVENKGGKAIPLADMLARQIATSESGEAINSYEQIGVDSDGREMFRMHKGVIHEYPVKTYLIQTNVPDHSIAPTLFGTQLRKIILGGINPNSTYEYKLGGKLTKVTGTQLISLWNALVSANFFKSFNEYERLIRDPHRLTKELSKNILSNDRSNLSSIDRIAKGLPYWDPMLQRDTFATLISLFKSTVSKQKIHGGNIVQASSLGANISLNYLEEGLKFETNDDGYPVKCETVMPFAFNVTNAFGEEIDLEYDDYCNTDGTFKVGRILEESDPEYNNYRAYVTEDGKVYKPKIEEEYPGILELVAYRIPTEREYSMLNLRVVRCCPKSGANYIQLPNICTTRAGFDFDIDKLYLVRRSFDSSISEHYTRKVWDNVWDSRPEIKDALQRAEKAATKDDIENIKSKYEKKGLEIPEKIPLNMYWDVAVSKGWIKEDKTEVFAAHTDESTLKSTTFTVLDAFNADGSLNYEAIFSGQVQKSDIDNLMLDIMQSRLSDPETAKARFTAGGFEDTILDAKFATYIQSMDSSNSEVNDSEHTLDLTELSKREVIRQLPEDSDNLLFDDPYTSIAYNKLNQAAAALIGIFANASSNYFIQSRLKGAETVGFKPIVFGSMIAVTKDDSGRSTYKPTRQDAGVNMLVNESLGKTISQRLAEFLAASVDAVKEPVLSYLNFNTVTADAAVVLVRMGYDVKDIGLLFNQPIIKEATTLMERDGISSLYSALDIVLKRHGMPSMKELTGKKAKSANLKYLTREALAYNLTKASGNNEAHFNTSQQEVVKVFYELMQIKDEYTKDVQESRTTSSNSTKTDVGSHLADADKRSSRRSARKRRIKYTAHGYEGELMPRDISKVASLEDRVKFFRTYENHPFAFEVVMYNLVADMFDSLVDRYTPYREQTFSTIFAAAKAWSRYGNVTKDTYNDLVSEVSKIIIKDLDGDFNPMFKDSKGVTNFDKYVKNFEKYITDVFSYIESLPEEERPDIESTGLFVGSSDFLKERVVNLTTVDEKGRRSTTEYSVLTLNPSFNITKEQSVSIYNNWQTLYNMGGVFQEYAKALFFHLYYINGMNSTSNFNLLLVPMNVLSSVQVDYSTGMDYVRFMDEMRVESEEDATINKIMRGVNPYTVLGKFIRQHLDNSSFCYKVTNAVKSKFVPSENSEKRMITLSKDDSKLVVKVIEAGGKYYRYAIPYIELDGRIYELQGFEGGKEMESTFVGTKEMPISYIEVTSVVDPSIAPFLENKKGRSTGGYLYDEVASAFQMSLLGEVSVENPVEDDLDSTSEREGAEGVFRRRSGEIDTTKKDKESGTC